MIECETIRQLMEDYVKEHGLVIVDVKNNKSNNIKIFFNIPGRNVGIDDCAALSRFIESRLDRDREDFSLTVSSAGTDVQENNKKQ